MLNLWETIRNQDKKPNDNKMYLTGDYLSAFNKGKQAEVAERVKHIKEF